MVPLVDEMTHSPRQQRAIGVTVNKEVNGRTIRKALHIAVPHLKSSTCQSQIIARKVENEAIKNAVR
eukprot:gene935-1231_t